MSSRVPVSLSPSDKAEVRSRAAAHGMSMSAFLRRAALGNRNAPADDPDAWWDSLTPSRKESVRRWLTEGRNTTHDVAGQLLLLDEDT